MSSGLRRRTTCVAPRPMRPRGEREGRERRHRVAIAEERLGEEDHLEATALGAGRRCRHLASPRPSGRSRARAPRDRSSRDAGPVRCGAHGEAFYSIGRAPATDPAGRRYALTRPRSLAQSLARRMSGARPREGAESEDAMKQPWRQPMRHWVLIAAVVGMAVLAAVGAFVAQAADPIKIGFGMALTGGLSANGKPALLALQIWKDDVNKKGGLLGRPVELVYYDDQTNPATVPGHLHEAARRRQGGPHHLGLRHQPHRSAHADRDGAQAPGHGDLRAGQQREIQVSELLSDLAERAGPGDQHPARLLRAGGPAESEAADGGDRGRRRRVSAERAGRRARADQEVRLQDGL